MSNTDPVRFELVEANNEYSQYLVRDAREIRFVMKQLAAKRSLISAYPDASPHFGLTSILLPDASNNELVLDVAADASINDALIAASNINCITQLDRVKVQFQLASVRPITHDGAPAFAAPLPEVLLRLQRREYFRLLAPVSHTMSCFIPLPGGAGFHEARVLDISGGGLAIVAPPVDAKLHPDMEIPNCRLEIPDTAPIHTTLRVRNIFRVTQRNGNELLRAGCQFVGLSPASENVIHRYILKVERDRATRVAQ